MILMRFDNEIKFYSESQQHYDPETSDYVGDIELIDTIFANVTDIGIDRGMALFGKMDTGSKIIRLINLPKGAWSYLTIDDDPKHYVLRSQIDHHHYSLIVGENHG